MKIRNRNTNSALILAAVLGAGSLASAKEASNAAVVCPSQITKVCILEDVNAFNADWYNVKLYLYNDKGQLTAGPIELTKSQKYSIAMQVLQSPSCK